MQLLTAGCCCAAGQTNYGYANTCLDVLAEQRRANGLPALSVQWGVIDHVGVADAKIQVTAPAFRDMPIICKYLICVPTNAPYSVHHMGSQTR